MSDDMIISYPEEGHGHDLSPFRDLNNEEKKVPWEKRAALIKEQFPSVTQLDWQRVFHQDPTIMGRIVNDIFKLDAAEPGKPGKRPSIDPEDARQRLRELLGDSYTILPFTEAFKALCGDRSIRHIAAKTEMDRSYIHRLLKGDAIPNGDQMAKIAKAFKKQPGYFMEYRMAYIVGVLHNKLMQSSEATISFYRKMQGLETADY